MTVFVPKGSYTWREIRVWQDEPTELPECVIVWSHRQRFGSSGREGLVLLALVKEGKGRQNEKQK